MFTHTGKNLTHRIHFNVCFTNLSLSRVPSSIPPKQSIYIYIYKIPFHKQLYIQPRTAETIRFINFKWIKRSDRIIERNLGPIENCLRRAQAKKVSLSTGECRPISKRRPEAANQYPRPQREMLIVETGRESTIHPARTRKSYDYRGCKFERTARQLLRDR